MEIEEVAERKVMAVEEAKKVDSVDAAEVLTAPIKQNFREEEGVKTVLKLPELEVNAEEKDKNKEYPDVFS